MLTSVKYQVPAAGKLAVATASVGLDIRVGRTVIALLAGRSIGRQVAALGHSAVSVTGSRLAAVVARDLLPEHAAAAPEPPITPTDRVLYSVVPFRMLLRYLLDPQLRATVKAAKRRAGTFHPLRYRRDGSLLRRLYVRALDARLVLKYRQHYPEPTESGF